MPSFKQIIKKRIPTVARILRKIQYALLGFLPRELVFTRFYRQRTWGTSETVSGAGSTLEITAKLRKELPELVESLEVQTMLDIPCGDFHWMKEAVFENVHYIGADIVRELIEINQKRYSASNRNFLHLDIIKDQLPDVDLIFCRDCFIHLSNKEIIQALENIRRSGARYLMTTTFPEIRNNKTITTGSFRPVNMELPPFLLGTPFRLIHEYDVDGEGYSKKCMGVWRIN